MIVDMFEVLAYRDKLEDPNKAERAINRSPVTKRMTKRMRQQSYGDQVKNFKTMNRRDQVAEVNKLSKDMVKGKLRLGSLLRNVRTQDWSQFDRKEWDNLQALAKTDIFDFEDKLRGFLRDKLRKKNISVTDTPIGSRSIKNLSHINSPAFMSDSKSRKTDSE